MIQKNNLLLCAALCLGLGVSIGSVAQVLPTIDLCGINETVSLYNGVNTKVVAWFLQRDDIDLTIQNDDGNTIIDLARDRPAILEMLEEYARRKQQNLIR